MNVASHHDATRGETIGELVSHLSDGSRRSNGSRDGRSSSSSSSSSSSRSSGGAGVTVDLGLSTVARNVTGLAAAVAGLASSVERAAVRGSAVAGNVTYKGQT